jgi:hypothetical protein
LYTTYSFPDIVNNLLYRAAVSRKKKELQTAKDVRSEQKSRKPSVGLAVLRAGPENIKVVLATEN